MKRKLIVVSHDAMVKEDLDHLYKRPAFRHFIDDGSFIETVRTVYPTVTYPCHASMISGCCFTSSSRTSRRRSRSVPYATLNHTERR